MAVPGYVTEDSTTDLPTQHGRPLNAAQPVLSSETCPTKKGRVYLWRQHSPCCNERSAVLRWEVCRAVFRNMACSCHGNIVSYFKYHNINFLRKFSLINPFIFSVSCLKQGVHWKTTESVLVHDPFKQKSGIVCFNIITLAFIATYPKKYLRILRENYYCDMLDSGLKYFLGPSLLRWWPRTSVHLLHLLGCF